jgi:hypothetical protein
MSRYKKHMKKISTMPSFKPNVIRATLSRIKALYPSANIKGLVFNEITADLLLRASTAVLEKWLKGQGIEIMDEDRLKALDDRLAEWRDLVDNCTDYRAVLTSTVYTCIWYEEEETVKSLYNQLQQYQHSHGSTGKYFK